jgi:hypothetical protein
MSNGQAAVNVENYSITETEAFRTQDLRRFSVVKKDGRKLTTYIVTFQRGHAFGCSCPAGRNQKHCKHVNMCFRNFQ